MVTNDDYTKYLELRKLLTKTSTNIITPNLGKGNHLLSTYLRVAFIAKTIDYLANMSTFSKIEKVEGSVITEAICGTSWMLGNIPTANCIDLLLFEMSEGLGLLDREDLGFVEVENPAHYLDKSKPSHIQKHLGYNYSLSEKGIRSYQNQEYQILSSNLLSSNINRLVSYAAVVIAFAALLVTIFTNK